MSCDFTQFAFKIQFRQYNISKPLNFYFYVKNYAFLLRTFCLKNKKPARSL